MTHYGSVRDALSLGPGPPPVSSENQFEQEGEWMESTWRQTSPALTSDSEDTFWNCVYNRKQVDVDVDLLRSEVVGQARTNMRAELARRKANPNRLRVEQRLLDQWRRAAVPTLNETPRLGRTTPDHLQSPFSRF